MTEFHETYRIHWKQWVRYKFLRGRTIGVYFLMVEMVISLYLLFEHHIADDTFYPLLVMTMTSYGVFTDLVSHLWYDSYISGISWAQFVRYALTGRWHDGYGMMIFMAAAIYYFTVSHSQWIVIIYSPITVSWSVIVGFLILTRFYH